jgi:predicted nucleotidyltransferase
MGRHPHPQVESTLERLLQQLQAAAGDNLLGVALYGSLVKGRFTPGISDINVLVVVADTGLQALLALTPVLTAALRESQVIPFVVTPEDLRTAALLFPVKILDIQLVHRVLWGDVHLAGIEVQPEALRLRALQELKNMELRMRLRVVERGTDPGAMWRGLTRALPKLAVTLEILLRTRGIPVPADRPGLLRAAARELGITAERIDRIADLRRVDRPPDHEIIRAQLAEYLAILADMSRYVEGELVP